MKERILAFLRAENKSSSQLAEEIGVQPSGISHIISGRNKPSLDFIMKMLEKYPFLSTEWLLFGKGDMYRDQSMQELFNGAGDAENKNQVRKQDIFTDDLNKEIQNSREKVQPFKTGRDVEKIAWFFKNGTFREYIPSEE